MKKFLSFLFVVCLTLCGGIFLTACGESSFKINIEMAESTQNLVSLAVTANGNLLDGETSFVTDASADVRIDLYAQTYGISLEDLSVKINSVTKSIIKDKNYSFLQEDQNLHYGYVLIPKISADSKVEISGGKQIESTFTFKLENLDNEENIEKLKMISVCMDFEDQPVFQNLYTLCTEESENLFTRSLAGADDNSNTYTTFKVKFDGIIPFDTTGTPPFKIVDSNGNEQTGVSLQLMGNYYLVDMGNLNGDKSYTISVDMSNIVYQPYQIVLSDDTMAYSLSVDDSVTEIDYTESAVITLKKLLDETKANYDNATVYVGTTALERLEDSLQTDENGIKFLLPTHSTPYSLGANVMQFVVTVSGVEYVGATYEVDASVDAETVNDEEFFTPVFYALSSSGEKTGTLEKNDNAKNIALDGEKISLEWGYVQESGSYYGAYKFNAYDLYLNDELLFNVQSVINSQEDQTKTFSKDFDNGFVLTVTYNENNKIYSTFSLTFSATENLTFAFKNFEKFQKNVNISWSFEDERVEKVEFCIETDNISWTTLEQDVSVTQTVYAGDAVKFRICTIRTKVGETDLKAEGDVVSQTAVVTEETSDTRYNYQIFTFYVSNLQYSETGEIKLVWKA